MKPGFKILPLILVAVISSAMTIFVISVARADDEDERWRQSRDAQYDLIAREKSLLARADDLSREIFELKRSINDLHKSLNAKQSAYQSVNHELISLQMQLLR
ncbi:MAG: hypothetical protein U0103_04745 [Candidatus Obscuribacterales bacterium]|nr:MAG: hypothetical protein EKK48_08240 [Candidatus Melainabacteria bacterium]